jgi:indolepyruvate ferredoxin oxidoreductase, beta subunit
MTFSMILTGVGGHGVLSAASIIAGAAVSQGLSVQQSEVHGMAQRGGSVVAHLRLADQPVASALIPTGTADLLLASELLEAVRELPYLSPSGVIVCATTEVRTMDGYPEHATLVDELRRAGRVVLVDAEQLARDSGSGKAATTVLLGAAARYMPLEPQAVTARLREQFAHKSARVADANLAAFAAGIAAGEDADAE